MEYGSIEREIHIDAAPEVVFEVVSSPEHLKEWWPDDVTLEPTPGSSGELIWRGESAPPMVVPITVVDADPPRLFSFRWCHSAGDTAGPGNSLLVTFELRPSGTGTVLRMTETGFREMGWEIAVLEQQYQEHVDGWNTHLPRLSEYLDRLVAAGRLP